MGSDKINRFRKSSLRLKDFDYSQEASYFITICVFMHFQFFGKIKFEKMILNPAGKMVRDLWLDLESHYDNLAIDEYIIMPNHIHSILILTDDIENRNYIRHNRLETESCRSMIYQTRLETKNCNGLIYQTMLDSNDTKRTHQTQVDHLTYTNKGSMNRTLTEKCHENTREIPDCKQTISQIIRHFKAKSCRILHETGYQNFRWQRNFYDHIIRNEKDFIYTKDYIINNPLKWTTDKYYYEYEKSA